MCFLVAIYAFISGNFGMRSNYLEVLETLPDCKCGITRFS